MLSDPSLIMDARTEARDKSLAIFEAYTVSASEKVINKRLEKEEKTDQPQRKGKNRKK